MAYLATIVPVMLASPSDATEEREIVRRVLYSWNYVHAGQTRVVLMPMGWDTHSSPELGSRPQQLINSRVLADCDLLIAIFSNRLGSPTGEWLSGTEEEIKRHMAAGKPVMVYFSEIPVNRRQIDRTQAEALDQFRSWCEGQGLIETFASHDELRNKVSQHLSIVLSKNSYLMEITENAPERHSDTSPSDPAPGLSLEAKELLLEGTLSQSGQILVHRGNSGTSIHTNHKVFSREEEDARTRARWMHGFEQLEEAGLIRDRGGKRVAFEISHQGFEIAERLRATGS